MRAPPAEERQPAELAGLSQTPGFSGLRSGGADRDRTDDLLNAIQALSQLSYGPILVLAARASENRAGAMAESS